MYRAGTFGQVLFVQWKSSPNATDLAAILPQVEEASRRVGGPVSYLTVIPPDAPVPSAEERKALEAFAEKLRSSVDHAYLVLEGNGFKASIQRSVVTGFTYLKNGGFTSIHKTVEEALHTLAVRSGLDYKGIASHARAQGLLP
jgi:hypothetical protein